MKETNKNLIAFFIFIIGMIMVYLSGYYAKQTHGWSNLLTFFSFVPFTISLSIGQVCHNTISQTNTEKRKCI